MTLEARTMALIESRFGLEAGALALKDDLVDRLGIDSMDSLSLLSELEAVFHVEVPDWELQDVRTVSDLVTVLRRCGAA